MIWGLIGTEDGTFNIVDIDNGETVISGVSSEIADKITEAHNGVVDEFIVKLKKGEAV